MAWTLRFALRPRAANKILNRDISRGPEAYGIQAVYCAAARTTVWSFSGDNGCDDG